MVKVRVEFYDTMDESGEYLEGKDEINFLEKWFNELKTKYFPNMNFKFTNKIGVDKYGPEFEFEHENEHVLKRLWLALNHSSSFTNTLMSYNDDKINELAEQMGWDELFKAYN